MAYQYKYTRSKSISSMLVFYERLKDEGQEELYNTAKSDLTFQKNDLDERNRQSEYFFQLARAEEDKEKAPETGAKNLGKPGATMLTFAGYALVGVIIGLVIATATKGIDTTPGFNPAGLIVVIPAVIGLIQKTTSDKPVTWHRMEARISGLALGALVAFIFA